jgi:hypothetical protein
MHWCIGWKRSIRDLVTSVIPTLGHDRNRCPKVIPIMPLRVAVTRRAMPERQQF